MSTLDRKQPFGEVWGGTGKARYSQHGKYFDAEAFQGVEKLAELPYFKRAAKYYERKLSDADILEQVEVQL